METNKTAAPHQQRVVDELADLQEKLDKLIAFEKTEKFQELELADRQRLLRQRDIMTAYANILGERIHAFPV